MASMRKLRCRLARWQRYVGQYRHITTAATDPWPHYPPGYWRAKQAVDREDERRFWAETPEIWLGGPEGEAALKRDVLGWTCQDCGLPDLHRGQGDGIDDDEGEHDDFATKVEELLLASAGFTEQWTRGAAENGYYDRKAAAEKAHGVELDFSGHSDYAGWLLVAAGSERNVEWAEVMTLDLDELRHEDRLPQWSKDLADALAALGITPTQKTAKWLVYPSYG